MTSTRPEKQLVLQAMQNLSFPLCQEVLDDAAQRVTRGAIQNPLAYLLAKRLDRSLCRLWFQSRKHR